MAWPGAARHVSLAESAQVVDFVSDLHLNSALPRTTAAFFDYLACTRADALVILGDLFEAWVGDDALVQVYERDCALALRAMTRRAPVWVMHGNRDFLLGPDFHAATGTQPLDDPTVMQAAWGERLLLSHGDALCVADEPYQAFRRQVRQPDWQRAFLAQPLGARQALARQMREASESHQHASGPQDWADVDPAMAGQWLTDASSRTLVHGHTHRPARHDQPGWTRHVLSDWDLDHAQRAEVLRWTASGLTRLRPDQA